MREQPEKDVKTPSDHCSDTYHAVNGVAIRRETRFGKADRAVDGIVQNRYANDPGKLAAWLSASHVEKAPKKKATLTP